MSSGPWKNTSSSSPAGDNSSTTRGKGDPSNFPPLAAQTQTKTQRRTRALYSQTPHFNPYPPRQEQLNRQELERLHLDDSEGGEGGGGGGGGAISKDDYDDDQGQSNGQTIGARSLGSGMSSITLLNKDGERFVRGGPDYYYTRRKHAPSSSSSKRNLQSASTPTQEKRQRAHFTKRRREGEGERQPIDLPTPFTDAKIEALLTECKRRQRALAAEQRLAQQALDNTKIDTQQQNSCKPFTDELRKAFSTLEGFLAAFSKDGVGEEQQETG